LFRRSEFTKRQYSTGEVAHYLGIRPQTVIGQDKKGLLSFHRTETNRRIMLRDDLLKLLEERGTLFNDEDGTKYDIIYCRVSSHEQKQKGDLDRQIAKVVEYASGKNLQNIMILKEVGSGLNDNRKQIQKLLQMVLQGEVNRIFVNYKDRLTRFGFHYIETMCSENSVEIHIVSDETTEKTVQDEMVEDMMALIASFSGKLYGMRAKEKKRVKELITQIKDIED
jgi:predicted site-specific integrase-resolvase